jgi:hypothetical protein
MGSVSDSVVRHAHSPSWWWVRRSNARPTMKQTSFLEAWLRGRCVQ